ncbi:MAG: abortive infection family protein, partial [Gemmataceae bacterium]
ISDWVAVEKVNWSGRLEEPNFLKRIFDVDAMPSHDGRFKSAANDIWQHRVNNNDWDDNWVFDDSRFEMMTGPADSFLRFLCEMLHPVVRKDAEEVSMLSESLNEFLRQDGVELVETGRISGRPVFSARRLSVGNATVITAVKSVTNLMNAEYVRQQTDRLLLALDEDAELAIGTAKEFVETVCKTILEEKGLAVDPGWDLPKLVRGTMKELKLVPDQVSATTKGADAIHKLLMNLASVANGMAEVRNLYGTGHGKSATTKGLQPRHARLAIGAASTLAVFLFETYQAQTRPSA